MEKYKKFKLKTRHHPFCEKLFEESKSNRPYGWTCRCKLLGEYDEWRKIHVQ